MRRAQSTVVWWAWIVAALTLAIPHGAVAHGVSLDVQAPFPETSGFHRHFMLPWAEKVERDSGGRIRLHLQAGASDRGSVLYERVLDGSVDIVWTAILPSIDRFAVLHRLQAGIDRSTGTESASRALWNAARLNDVLDRDFDGVHVLAIHYYQPAGNPDGVATEPEIGVLAMSSGSFRALADDLKAVLDTNSGEETAAWLARALNRLRAPGTVEPAPPRDHR